MTDPVLLKQPWGIWVDVPGESTYDGQYHHNKWSQKKTVDARHVMCCIDTGWWTSAVIDALHPGYGPPYKASTSASDKPDIYMLYRAKCTTGPAWRGPCRIPVSWAGIKNEVSPWWRHDMETVCPLLALCDKNRPVTRGSLTKDQLNRGFVFLHCRLGQTVEWTVVLSMIFDAL